MQGSALHTLVINSLAEQIAVIDPDGVIVDVNAAWTNFGAENGLSSESARIGANYLTALSASVASGDSLAGEAERGILDVMDGKRDEFHLEYPCHSPNEQRWFMMRIARLHGSPESLFVISHYNITRRKLAEERAEQLAMQDPLTTLANRRHFDLFLNREIRRSIRHQSMISLIEVDVDHFKDYNDEFGHPAGDQCLIKIAHVLQARSRRPSDLAVRLGGDEFALLLGESNIEESQQVAESIQMAINNLGMVFGESRQVTASVGVASLIYHDLMKPDFLLQQADNALYRAKLAGRNQVVRAQHVDEKPVERPG